MQIIHKMLFVQPYRIRADLQNCTMGLDAMLQIASLLKYFYVLCTVCWPTLLPHTNVPRPRRYQLSWLSMTRA